MAFNSSLVLEGEGLGVVVATGDHSLIGRIAVMASSVQERPSTMQIEVRACRCVCVGG